MSKAIIRNASKLISLMLVFLLVLGGINVLPAAAAEEETQVYVSPDGDDNNAGTLSAPFKTIERARNAVRDIIAQGMTSDVAVILRGGIYYLSETLTFDDRDSGNNGYNVIYTNYPGEEPILDGGIPITNWEQYSGNIYMADVGEGISGGYEEILGDELLTDGGFEAKTVGWPAISELTSMTNLLYGDWYVGLNNALNAGVNYGKEVDEFIEIVDDESYAGDKSLHYYETANTLTPAVAVNALMAAQVITIDPAKTYRFSFSAKWVQGQPGFIIRPYNTGTNSENTVSRFMIRLNEKLDEWVTYSYTVGPVGSGADYPVFTGEEDRVRVELRNYGNAGTFGGFIYMKGEAYYDDVSFKEVLSENIPVYDGMSFNTLYENNNRSYKARTPNINSDGTFNYHIVTGTGDSIRFQFKPGDIPEFSDMQGLQTYIFPGNNWCGAIYNIASINYSSNQVTLTHANTQSIYFRADSRYFVQGALELLDSPGEFHLDKTTGTLYYWPRGDINNPDTVITAPVLKRVIEIIGGENLVFDGITVRNADTSEILNRNQIEGQNLGYLEGNNDFWKITDEIYLNAAVYMENTANISYINGKVYNAGVDGLSMVNGAAHNVISGNHIYNTGLRGIVVQGKRLQPNQISIGNLIQNNQVHGIGQIASHEAAGIEIITSEENIISHNLVYDTARYGITVIGDGVSTGAAYISPAPEIRRNRNNRVEYNDVYNATVETGDTAPIYLWGHDGGGIVIDNNRVHHSDGRQSTGLATVSGIYLDGGPTDVQISNNIVDNLQHIPGQLYAGTLIAVSGIKQINNIFANNEHIGAAQLLTEDGVMEHNIIYNSGKRVYQGNQAYRADGTIVQVAHVSSDNNIFYNEAGEYEFELFGARYKDIWQGLGYDQNSLFEDPIFMDEENYDYRLHYSSPAISLGIQDINMRDIGLTSDYLYTDENDPLNMVFAFIQAAGNKSYMSLPLGQTAQLEVTGRSATGFASDLNGAGITYLNDNPLVAGVDAAGAITALSEGVARITAVVTLGGVTKSSSFDVLCGIDGAMDIELVENHSADLKPIIAQILPGFYDPDTSLVTYTSANPLIVSVDAQGIATGNGIGVADILAVVTTGGVTQKVNIKINVIPNVLSKVKLTAPKLTVGEKLLLECTLADGTPADLTGATIIYNSDDLSVIGIDADGVITFLSKGNATITVEVTTSDGVTQTGSLLIMFRSAYEQIRAVENDGTEPPVKVDENAGPPDWTKPANPPMGYIWDTYGDGWARFDNIYFDQGASEIVVYHSVNNRWAGAPMEIRLDAPDGELIGTMFFESTNNDWGIFEEQTIPVDYVSGQHDVYLVFPYFERTWHIGVDDGAVYGTHGNIVWFTFIPGGEPDEPIEDVVLLGATPEAWVEKLNGNQNRLFIKITESYSDGSTAIILWDGLIANNAAGIYAVDDYLVYVNTKGNVQIRDIYIVE